ncbi:MAG TPA: hypothetical protein VF743_06400 [Acidimicrobiales bacterium]
MDRNDGDRIRLSVPATPAAVRITRVGAAGLATRAGFTYREVEEVRLAVGEAAAVLTLDDGGGGGTLVVVYALAGDALHVELRLDGTPAVGPPSVPALAAAVLDDNVDAWETVGDGDPRLVLHKYRTDVDDDDE